MDKMSAYHTLAVRCHSWSTHVLRSILLEWKEIESSWFEWELKGVKACASLVKMSSLRASASYRSLIQLRIVCVGRDFSCPTFCSKQIQQWVLWSCLCQLSLNHLYYISDSCCSCTNRSFSCCTWIPCYFLLQLGFDLPSRDAGQCFCSSPLVNYYCFLFVRLSCWLICLFSQVLGCTFCVAINNCP